jgi:tRNA(Ile)-lysidine synthase
MPPAEMVDAVASVPPGGWAVGVSGGADSVALLSILRSRGDVAFHVVHLDHETRGEASAGDARFVAELAGRWRLPCTVARWRDVEGEVGPAVRNASARFRAGRWALFRRVVAAHGLQGVILAHHADDQAETVMLRLLRGSGPSGLGGMRPRAVVGGIVVLRPLLRTRRVALRDWLRAAGQAWREDESNESDKYLRNRVRCALASRPGLTDALIEVSDAAREVAAWTGRNATRAEGPELGVATLRDVPTPLARETARRWLTDRGAPAGELTGEVLDRLVLMAADAASPARQHFPGGVLVRRRSGRLFVDGSKSKAREGDGDQGGDVRAQ